MASRYPLSTRKAGGYFGTSTAMRVVKRLIENGTVSVRVEALQDSERLDVVAQRVYGDASLWWVVAAASNIGWGLQVPPGTRLVIPTNINPIIDALG